MTLSMHIIEDTPKEKYPSAFAGRLDTAPVCLPHVVYLWISRSLGLSQLEHSELLGREDPIFFF